MEELIFELFVLCYLYFVICTLLFVLCTLYIVPCTLYFYFGTKISDVFREEVTFYQEL